MIRLPSLLRAAGLSFTLAAAAAASPPVLDRVPTDALVVVAAPSLDRLSKSMETVTSSVHLPMPTPGLAEMLTMSGFEKGIDTTRSVAVVVLPFPEGKAPPAKPAKKADMKDADKDEEGDDDPAPEPPFVILLPTSDYDALLGNFDAKPGAAGPIDTVQVTGQTMYLKSIGEGYAAMSTTKDAVEKFSGKAGNAKAHDAAMGKTCGAIADASDLVVIANIPAIKAMPGPSLQDRMTKAMANSPMAMMGGGGEPDFAGMEAFINSITEQARIGVIGLKVDAAGVGIDMAAQFNEGTALAKTFAKGGNAAGLMKKLPKQDYLLAFAADMADPTIRDLAKKANPAGAAVGDAGKDAQTVVNAVMGPLDQADGMAISLGASPAMMMGGGLLTNTVAYIKTSDPDAYIKAGEQAAKDLNDKAIAGNAFSTSYTPATSKVGDTSIDTWSVKITPDDDAGMASQVMMGLFPSGGPGGYVAKADGGVVRTLGKNSLLMSASLDAAKGNNSMAADTLAVQVGERLAPGRMIEVYLGVKAMLDMVKPMMAMMGGGAEPDLPDVIPPVGIGLGGTDGAGRASIYVPMPVIKAISAMTQAFQQGAGGEDAPPPRRPKAKDGAGQPRF